MINGDSVFSLTVKNTELTAELGSLISLKRLSLFGLFLKFLSPFHLLHPSPFPFISQSLPYEIYFFLCFFSLKHSLPLHLYIILSMACMNLVCIILQSRNPHSIVFLLAFALLFAPFHFMAQGKYVVIQILHSHNPYCCHTN